MKTLRFGIEIETVGQPRDTVARAIHSVVGGYLNGASVRTPDGRVWQVVHDGSLNGSQNGEIVSPILTYADLDQLQEVVRAVRHAGCRADDSTGIHIHVDGSRFDAKGVVNLVKTINKQERLIEHALGIRVARLGRYCKPIDQEFLRKIETERPRTLQDVSRAWYGQARPSPTRYDQSRYHGLNLNSLFFRGTIEFRYFNGTLHAGEVKAYVQFVLALAAKALASKAASSKKREFQEASAKYDFRVFLLGLGLIGEEFKTARLHLLKHLGGSAAWKNGRPPRARASQPADGSPADDN